MKNKGGFVVLLAGLVLTSGCLVTFITPKTAALSNVHEAYAEDFDRFNLPSPKEQPAANSPSNSVAFARSLRSIQEYRQKYPGDSQELAHLKVLEGMIYLQSGRFGLAEAIRPEVEEAGRKLSSATGKAVRDELFAKNFGTLIEGWTETKKKSNRRWENFDRVANKLHENVAAIPANKRAEPGADQGALYLATSAGIFRVWAFSEFAVVETNQTIVTATNVAWFSKSTNLMAQFLTEAEKNPKAGQDIGQESPGRLRYVEWYHWFRRKLEQ
jgi:hypothetical protein